jgi:arsenate reductase-like glutaredoxin family protein
MGVIAQDNKQMNFYYSEDSSIAKQSLGYLEASEKKIQLININETKLTGTQWAELSQGVGTTIDGLISKDHPSAKDVIKDGDFDEHDWIDILNNCPQVFEYPVAMNGTSFLLVKTPSDILKFYGVDSPSLDKPKLGEDQDTTPAYKNDNYIE